MTLTYDLDLQFLRVIVMTYLDAQVERQRSVGSEDRVETKERTDGRTEAIALPPPSLMRSVNVCQRASVYY